MPLIKISPLLALLSFIALGGCSNSPSEQAQSEKIKKMEAKQETAKNKLSEYPKWYLEPASNEASTLHAKVTTLRDDPQSALSDAATMAEYELAGKIKKNISGLSKIYMDNMNTKNSSESKIVIESFVNKTEVTGYYITKRDIVVEDGKYRGFVWLTWDLDKAFAIQQQTESAKRTHSDNAKALYEELHQNISLSN